MAQTVVTCGACSVSHDRSSGHSPHSFKSFSTSVTVLLYQPSHPPSLPLSFPFISHSCSSLALSLSTPVSPPCLRHLFIEASCQHTAYPPSLPPHHPLRYTKTQAYALSQRRKHTSGWHKLLQTPAMPLHLILYMVTTTTAVSLLIHLLLMSLHPHLVCLPPYSSAHSVTLPYLHHFSTNCYTFLPLCQRLWLRLHCDCTHTCSEL